MTQSHYTIGACENLLDQYADRGGEWLTVEEGGVGLGTIVAWGEGLKTTVIQEHYQNEMSSTHTMRMYNKMPKKYSDMIDAYYDGLDEDEED